MSCKTSINLVKDIRNKAEEFMDKLYQNFQSAIQDKKLEAYMTLQQIQSKMSDDMINKCPQYESLMHTAYKLISDIDHCQINSSAFLIFQSLLIKSEEIENYCRKTNGSDEEYNFVKKKYGELNKLNQEMIENAYVQFYNCGQLERNPLEELSSLVKNIKFVIKECS